MSSYGKEKKNTTDWSIFYGEDITLKRVSICLVLTTGLLFVLVTLLFCKVVLTACRL